MKGVCLLIWRHLLLGLWTALIKWCWNDRMTWAFVSTPPSRLLEHFRKHKYLSSSGEQFALLVSSLLENLLDYRTIIMHDESKENRMSCTVNVLVGAKPLGWREGTAGLPCATHQLQVDLTDTETRGHLSGVCSAESNGDSPLIVGLADTSSHRP